MQVEDVEFVRGHQVQIAQHALLGHEVPRDVEEEAAPAEPGGVLDDLGRDPEGGVRPYGRAPEGVGTEQLAQGLGAPEHPGGPAAADLHAPAGDGSEPVPLRRRRVVQQQPHRVPVVRRPGPQRQTQGLAEGWRAASARRVRCPGPAHSVVPGPSGTAVPVVPSTARGAGISSTTATLPALQDTQRAIHIAQRDADVSKARHWTGRSQEVWTSRRPENATIPGTRLTRAPGDLTVCGRTGDGLLVAALALPSSPPLPMDS